MVSLLNRMAWILSLVVWISIFAIDEELFILWLILIFLVKFFLSKQFIKDSVEEYYNIWNKTNKPLKNENIVDVKSSIETSIKKASDSVEVIKETVKRNIVNDEKITKHVEQKVQIVKEEPSKIMKFFSEFFAENLFAKIGWILLALWVIFLMSLVYSLVWPVLKIIIWFLLWFWVYVIWVFLEKKWFKTEWMILLWTWILINYIVTLWWRFVIGDEWGFLSSGITFLFLILNTLFSVLTSYLYNSRNILLFSIFFAYIIPFLVWSSWSEYSFLVIVGYSLILTIWTLFVSNQKHKSWEIITSKILFYFSIILWNLLVLASPFNNEFSFITKIVWFNLITFSNIYIAYIKRFSKDILPLFFISFAFLILILTNWIFVLWGTFSSMLIFLSYIASIFFLLFALVFFIYTWIWAFISYLLFFPIFIIMWLLFTKSLLFWIFIIPLILIVYLVIFSLLWAKIFSSIFKYIFFAILWVFLLISNSYFISFNLIWDFKDMLVIVITAFVFMISSYFYSSKKDLSLLYSIWTLISIFILLPVIKITWEFTQISIISVVIFGILNYFTPFINSNLVKNDTKNLVLWNIFWVLFIWWNLFKFWQEYFPWTTLWISFWLLAILYFIWWFLLFSKFSKNSDIKKESNINFIYTFLAIAISLFSISIALVFSQLPIVIALIWLLESSVVLFFANKLKSSKVLIAWIILFIIWIVKYISLFMFSSFQEVDMIANILVFVSLFINVIFVKKIESEGKIFVQLLHVLGVVLSYFWFIEIFDLEIDSWNFLVFSWTYLFVVSLFYWFIKENSLKIVFVYLISIFFLAHIFSTGIFDDYKFNYIFTFITFLIVVINYVFFKDKDTKYLSLSYLLYFFVITSIYLYDFTNDYFSLTIYWWILSLLWVHIWIFISSVNVRAVWLFLLIFTLLKISFYDIWNWIDNPILRVIAFMFVWWIMMYISVLYWKNNLSLKKDFSLEITDKKSESNKNNWSINDSIKDINVDWIESIKFTLLDWKSFVIKSKNLYKIAILIKEKTNKTSFKPWELNEIYNRFVDWYKTEISQTDYKKLLWVMKNFVDIWGNFEINKK